MAEYEIRGADDVTALSMEIMKFINDIDKFNNDLLERTLSESQI